MGYIHSSESDPGLGYFGCGGGCPCAACVARSRALGEWYIREEPEDDDAEEEERAKPAPRPRPTLGEPQAGPRPIEIIEKFAFDGTTVPGPEHAKLIRVARLILGGQRGPYRLVGHTDPVGTDAYNNELGRRRAAEVQRQMQITLERMRPGSSRGIVFTIDTRGEKEPVAPNTDEAGRARNRRVEIFGPAPRPTNGGGCRYRIADALAIEREAARRTLAVSADVARRFIRTLGALSARGRFIPTIIDNKYWFAKLYEMITYEEIAAIGNFQQPAFVMHFIPVFYNLYLRALDNPGAAHALWTRHFTAAARPDNSSISAWMDGVRNSIVTGVTAHIQGDMATALEQAYRSYVAKYCLSPPPPFDQFRPDFFGRNRIVFQRAEASFLLHASQFSPFPVGPEFGQYLFAVGARVTGSLDLDEVFRWRESAWSEAKRRLGQ